MEDQERIARGKAPGWFHANESTLLDFRERGFWEQNIIFASKLELTADEIKEP